MSTWRDILPIERALESVFARVLRTCDGAPPQLDSVDIMLDMRQDSFRIRASFRVEGGPDYYSEAMIPSYEIRRWELPRRNGQSSYDAQRLWSRMYEDHYIRRMERARSEAAFAAYENGNFQVGEYLHRQASETASHARQNHVSHDVSLGYRDMPESRLTATEAYARSREAARAIDTDLERRMIEAAYGGTTSNSDDQSPPAMTLETINAAMRALELSPVSRQWRNAFMRAADNGYGIMGYDNFIVGNLAMGAMGGFLNPEVGTAEAQARGIELLKESLTAEQRSSYEKHQYFEVKGSDTGTRYRIKHGRQMNIDVLDGSGSRVSGICFLPVGTLVAGDCMLAQKLALELEETEALKIANRFN